MIRAGASAFGLHLSRTSTFCTVRHELEVPHGAELGPESATDRTPEVASVIDPVAVESAAEIQVDIVDGEIVAAPEAASRIDPELSTDIPIEAAVESQHEESSLDELKVSAEDG